MSSSVPISNTLKVGHFTIDNAGNNATTMDELARLLHERDIEFDAKDRSIMCFEHVVNLCSGRVIDGLTKALADSTADDWVAPPPPSLRGSQSYAEAVERDPVALGRAVVRAIRASGARRDAFDDVIKTGNEKGWFREGTPPNQRSIKVKQLQLLRDVSTRWDSVYYMLNRLREMRPVCLPYNSVWLLLMAIIGRGLLSGPSE